MMPFWSKNCLQSSLVVAVYTFVLSTCSSKECGLQMTGKMKERSIIFRNVDTKTCQLDCNEDSFIFANCHRSGDSKKIKKTNGPSSHSENQSHTDPRVTTKVPVSRLSPWNSCEVPRQCGKKVCTHTSRCVEDGCQKICVQSLSFSELHSASQSGDVSKVKAILTKGRADINCKKWIGRTPVMVAAEKGHRTVVEFLVSNGADMSVVDNYGMNILHSACLGGDTEVVKYVLSKEKVDINGQVGCGGTPVMLAARNGHKEVVELLVNKGAQLSLTDKRGENILHVTCWGGHMEVVKYVLSQDVININSVDLSRKTPVMVAEERGHKDVVDLLLSKGDHMPQVKKRRKKGKKRKGKSIIGACRAGNMKAVKSLLKQDNTLINYQGRALGMTPVMTAAKKGHKEVVEFLISKGANMTLVDKRGCNVLHVACLGGFMEMVKHILSKNIFNINSIDTSGRTPAMTASEKGHTEVVQFLLSRGADTSLVDKNSNNILHLACQGGNVEMVKYILKQVDVGINSRGSDGMTPLIVAANNGHMEVFELLVNKGANKSLVDKSGNNILHAACRGGNIQVVKYVLSLDSVDIYATNEEYDTAADIAEEYEFSDILNLF